MHLGGTGQAHNLTHLSAGVLRACLAKVKVKPADVLGYAEVNVSNVVGLVFLALRGRPS